MILTVKSSIAIEVKYKHLFDTVYNKSGRKRPFIKFLSISKLSFSCFIKVLLYSVNWESISIQLVWCLYFTS